MVFIYLIIGINLIVGLFSLASSHPAPETGITEGFFYYRGIPVRKCREVTTDDDGNFLVDGELLTVRELDAWHRNLTQ